MRETKVTLPETSERVRLTLEVVISEVRYGTLGKAIVGQGGGEISSVGAGWIIMRIVRLEKNN